MRSSVLSRRLRPTGILTAVATATAAIALVGAPVGAAPKDDADDAETEIASSEQDDHTAPAEERYHDDEVDELHEDPTIDVENSGDVRVSEPTPMGPIPEPDVEAEVDRVLGDVLGERTENAVNVASFGQDPASFSNGATQADAFSLHSRPGADRTIFLDFDGHVTTGQIWNVPADVPDPLVTGSYSRESNGSENETFSQLEIDSIIAIWAQVVDDFAAWDVNVTTADPGVEALRKTSAADTRYGQRIVITHDSDWYGPFGGTAYLHTFDREVDRPAFVFSDNLGAGNAKAVGEAISHEAGHTLGLLHDGQGSSSYYAGHGDWAPIMGVGYYRDITQWSNGDYPHATNTEDDLAIIDSYLTRSASPASAVQSFTSTSSTLHAITTGGGTTTHTVELAGPGSVAVGPVQGPSNLLADVTIRSGISIVASSSASAAGGWGLDADLGAGTYSVEVRSVGDGTPSTGFSSYGSIGQYRLAVDAPATPPGDDGSGSGSGDSGSGGDTTPPPPTTDPTADAIRPISPVRVFDSRSDSGGRMLGARQQVEIVVAGRNGVPADATAAAVNVAAVRPGNGGWVSLTPCNPVAESARTSSLNFGGGGATANASIVPLSEAGTLCAFASTPTHLVVDVTAVVSPTGTVGLTATGADRVVDTRSGLGVPTSLTAGRTVAVDVGPHVDAATTAVAVNVTAVRPMANGFVTVDDCSGSATTAALNVKPGVNRGNNGVFGLDARQRLCVTSSVDTHLTIDLTGQFAPGGKEFLAATPERILDTRDRRSPVGAGSQVTVRVPAAPVSSPVVAASVNVTSAGHGSAGFVTAWDCGTRPVASALNPVPGQPTANGALVEVGNGTDVCLYHDRGGHLIVDLTGWWV